MSENKITYGEKLSLKKDGLAFKKKLEYEIAKKLWDDRVIDITKYPPGTLTKKKLEGLPSELVTVTRDGRIFKVYTPEEVLSTDIYSFRNRLDALLEHFEQQLKDIPMIGLETRIDIYKIKDGKNTTAIKNGFATYWILKSEKAIEMDIRRELARDINNYFWNWFHDNRASLYKYRVSKTSREATYPKSGSTPSNLLKKFMQDQSDWDALCLELFKHRIKNDNKG